MGQDNLRSPGIHKVHIKKEALKFSSAHMTVFPDGTKESLHGHNYTVDVTLHLQEISFREMISFSEIKDFMREICKAWDEKVLLPKANPFFVIRNESPSEIEFQLCNKRYVLPKDEVELLQVDNVSSERLAEEFGLRLMTKLETRIQSGMLLGIQVRIEESPGQGSSFEQYEFK